MEGPSSSVLHQQPPPPTQSPPTPLILQQPPHLLTSDMDRLAVEPSSSSTGGSGSGTSSVVSSLASSAASAIQAAVNTGTGNAPTPPESSSSSTSASAGGNSTGVITTSSVVVLGEEPCKKKAKLMDPSGSSGNSSPGSSASNLQKFTEKLELRLGGILCCAVCLDLPRAAIYQCTNGHLMCAGCFTHLLADARLRDEIATCPNCRVEISKHIASRNLAVEKAVNELPAECQYCNKEFPRNTLDHHERELCEERTTSCKFHRIGCPWRGPYHELKNHQENCIHPKKSGAEVMDILRGFDMESEKDKKMYNNIFDLLSYEKINFNDLQLKPYRTDEFVHKLYYETSRFSAFNNQWVVKARINNNQKDPTQSCDRNISYQLILKTKPSTSLDVSFVILKGPFGDMKVSPAIHRFEFSEQNNESPYFSLPINEVSEVNRLLAQKAVHFRLIAFLQ